MSDFDWPAFLNRYGIEHTNHGPSTAKGNLYIHCPFCGAADRGQHMGVSLNGRGWGCWKNADHRGRNPTRLIAVLLGVSYAEAARIAGVGGRGLPSNPQDALSNMLSQLTGEQVFEKPKLHFPREFSNRWDSNLAEPFLEYLYSRGYSANDATYLIERFQLQYALSGDYRYRIIIPVFDHSGELFSWTGRALDDNRKDKYKTLSNHAERPPIAHGPTSDTLLDLPRISEGGDFLVVCEGPFDALRLTLYTEQYDAHATCLFGKQISLPQLDLLSELRTIYNDIFVLLDPDAALDILPISTMLDAIGVRTWAMSGDQDPGEMLVDVIHKLFSDLQLATETN